MAFSTGVSNATAVITGIHEKMVINRIVPRESVAGLYESALAWSDTIVAAATTATEMIPETEYMRHTRRVNTSGFCICAAAEQQFYEKRSRHYERRQNRIQKSGKQEEKQCHVCKSPSREEIAVFEPAVITAYPVAVLLEHLYVIPEVQDHICNTNDVNRDEICCHWIGVLCIKNIYFKSDFRNSRSTALNPAGLSRNE